MKFSMSRYDYPSINSLELCVAFTNSELMSSACPKKYGYSYIENIDYKSFSYAMTYGTCWHYMCEMFLNQMILDDTTLDNENMEEILENKVSIFIRSELDQYYIEDKEETFEKIYTSLSLGMYGWMNNWKQKIYPRFQVVGIERELIKPIFDREKVLKTKVSFIKEHHIDKTVIIRHPLISELTDNRYVNVKCGDYESRDAIYADQIEKEVPVYKVGKLDCILLERDSNALWILDHKTSGSPVTYAKKMQFDLQLYSYCSLLDYYIKTGRFDYLGNVFIGGIIWDITTSKFNKPSFDKDGYLKQVKRGYITHSLAKNILQDVRYELMENEYDDYLEILKERDKSNFLLIEEMVSTKDIERVNNEEYANAINILNLRSKAHNLDPFDRIEQDRVLSRFPICMTYNYCQYFSTCSTNLPITDPNLLHLNRIAKQYWIGDTDVV